MAVSIAWPWHGGAFEPRPKIPDRTAPRASATVTSLVPSFSVSERVSLADQSGRRFLDRFAISGAGRHSSLLAHVVRKRADRGRRRPGGGITVNTVVPKREPSAIGACGTNRISIDRLTRIAEAVDGRRLPVLETGVVA